MPPKPFLNVRKFNNTILTSHHAPKVFPTDLETAPTITVGVFFDGHILPNLEPFYITFPRRNTMTLALEKLCKAVNVKNKNHLEETEDEDRWSVFCLTSAMGIPVGEMFDGEAMVQDVARHSDFWFVTKGQTFPEGLAAEAEGRLKKLIAALPQPKPAAAAAAATDDSPDETVAATPEPPAAPAAGPKKILVTKQQAAAPKASATKKAQIAAAAAVAAAVEAQNPTVRISATFPEFEGEVIFVTHKYDDTVNDLMTSIYRALTQRNLCTPKKSEADIALALTPFAVLNGVKAMKMMFCDKYIHTTPRETLRKIPLMDGSAVVVCTGKYAESDHEMTLFMAERNLKEVRHGITALLARASSSPSSSESDKKEKSDETEEKKEGSLIDFKTRAHWDELLMRSLSFLDSLQEVPEDIRQRRKDGVKVTIAEQDRLAAL